MVVILEHVRHKHTHTHARKIEMTYKAKSELVHNWPALKVYERKTRTHVDHGEYIEIDDADCLHRDGPGLGPAGRTYNASSVFTYAMRHGDCPLESYQRAVENCHDIYWINQESSVISDAATPEREAVRIRIKQVVRFQGKFFEIRPRPNDNLELQIIE